MDFNRFGRLNTKKLNEYIDEIKNDPDSTLLDMSKLFPILPTRDASKKSRYLIKSFNWMIEHYRYCYKLFSDCIAEIKMVGINEYEQCLEINNNLYVFTNEENIDDADCELVYDRDKKIFIKAIKKKDNDELDIDIITDVLNQMKKRRIPNGQIKAIEHLITHVSFLELNFNNLPKKLDKHLDKSVYNEFIWRILLYSTDIYKNDYEERKLKRKKVKIEDGYSITKEINSYGMLDWFYDEMELFDSKYSLLSEYKSFNHTYSINKLATDIREDTKLEFWFEELKRERSFKSLLENKIKEIENFLEVYSFINNHRSKQYRHIFNKYIRFLTKWQTQQVFRKFKQEYKEAENKLSELYLQFEKIEIYDNQFIEIDNIYKNNLGENGISNNGFGYIGDGLKFNDNDIANEIRANAQQELDNERQERIDYYNEKERIEQEAYEEEQEKLYDIYSKLEVLYNDNEPIFELLKEYYNLDFENMYPNDEELHKMKELVLEAPYREDFYFIDLIKSSDRCRENPILTAYRFLYRDEETVYSHFIRDIEYKIEEIETLYYPHTILDVIETCYKLDYKNITKSNAEKIYDLLNGSIDDYNHLLELMKESNCNECSDYTNIWDFQLYLWENNTFIEKTQ